MNDRILIAGTHSGCGKTSVTCGLLQALQRRGSPLRAFKCGPDYIDPMFHREVIGVPAENLDPFFLDESALRLHLGGAAENLSIIEGVMGYYDGIGMEGRASTFHAAQATRTPVLLVIDAQGSYTSCGAVLRGFLQYRPHSGIQGVIFNNAAPSLYPGLCQIAREEGVEPLGFLPRCKAISLASRHLGLITALEIADLRQRLDRLGDLAEEHLALDTIVELAAQAPPLPTPVTPPAAEKRVRIAVARDEAFCFLYAENLRLLETLGAELVFFSPLRDADLPEDIGGLYLPGGYPELHTRQLSANPLRGRIRQAIQAGLPTVAECGGFLYLHDTLDGAEMAGVIHARARRADTLRRFGYATLTARRDNLLCTAGQQLRVHEFHYYESTADGDAFRAQKPSGDREWDCVHATDTLWAGFPHLYFPAEPSMAARFVRKAESYAAL